MPYRHAHWYLLLLFPLTGLAFWPNYFSKFSASPYAFHVHGITAALWIALLAAQSWTIHHRRNPLHRSVGLTSLALFPFFLVGGLLVLQTMAHKVATHEDPFYDLFGARLGTMDALSSIALPFLFYPAIRWRRKVHIHARYMLAPVLFLLGPILSRLMPALPPLAITGPETFYRFAYGLHVSNAIAVAIAAFLSWRAPKHGRPFLVVGGLIVLQSLLFETLGRTPDWEALYVSLAQVPTPLVVSLGLAAGILAGAAGWIAGQKPARREATA
jgi:glucan phosphoethanolaminetransferase (alkaline phosphatase superfamily)